YEEALRRLRATGTAVELCRALLQAATESQPHVSPLEPTKAYRECIALSRERGLRSLLAHALRGLADAYVADGRNERALTLAEEAVEGARETTEAALIQACLELLSRLHGTQEADQDPAARASRPVQGEPVVVREAEPRRSRWDRKRVSVEVSGAARG